MAYRNGKFAHIYVTVLLIIVIY